jgi:hypothetical protein
MNLRTQSRMTWITLVACVLLALTPASGFVLCLGHASHVGFGTVESSHPADALVKTCPCLESASAKSSAAGSVEDRFDDDHPPCRDLEFAASPLEFSHGGGADVGGSADSSNFSPFPLLAAIPWRTMPVGEAGSLSVRPPGALASQALTAGRTVVLLI